MFEAPSVLIWTGIPLVVSLYCCLCFLLCRRRGKSEVKEGKIDITKEPNRRFIEIHHQVTGAGSPHCDYPILHRVQYPQLSGVSGTSLVNIANGLLHFQKANMTTISVIDPQTKLSFNPSIAVEESGCVSRTNPKDGKFSLDSSWGGCNTEP